MKTLSKSILGLLFLLALSTPSLYGQQKVDNARLLREIRNFRTQVRNNRHTYDVLKKRIDDLMWHELLGDVAYIDKVRLTGPPRWKPKTENDRFAANPFRFWSYVFIPKNVDESKKYPLIVLPHSGIHSDFGTGYAHIVRELIAQGFIIVSAEYRGSTGYGRRIFEDIDYGGLENEDVLTSRDYMVENYEIVDESRIGIIGWSHGGMISLMNILNYPDKYNVAYAGVPVSDLESRLGSHNEAYARNFTAKYHIGETIEENPMEYKRRSPSFHAHKLRKPLMIYTNTNDDDVHVEEVLVMIDSLKHHKKDFKYKVFQDEPGGHSFDRLDSREGTEIRYTIYQFLEPYLLPPTPFKNHKEMRRAAYRFTK